MNFKFYNQKEEGCFGTALANYFIATNNNKLAEKVFSKYYSKKGVGGNYSTLTPLIPSVVRNLTQDSYSAKLYANITEKGFQNLAQNFKKDIIEKVRNQAEKDKKDGWIISSTNSITYKLPAIISINDEILEKHLGTFNSRIRYYSHAILQLDKDLYVNRGLIKIYPNKAIFLRGIIEIVKL